MAAHLRRSRASPEVALGIDAPAPAREASPEEQAQGRKNVRPRHYTGRQLSDILKRTFSRN